MAQRFRFSRDWDFRPNPAVVIAHQAGEMKRLPEAQVKAALAAGAGEVIDGSKPLGEQEPPAAEDEDAAGRGSAGGRKGGARKRR